MGLHDKSLIEPVERIIVSINLTDVLGGSYNPLFVDKCVFGDPSGMLKQVQMTDLDAFGISIRCHSTEPALKCLCSGSSRT